MHYMWCAVDQEGDILESYVTKTRDKSATLTFIKKVLGNTDKQEFGRWANNRVENSHLPFRRRERAMLRFRQMKSLQKFASVHDSFHNHFASERHLIDGQKYKFRRSAALVEWRSLMG